MKSGNYLVVSASAGYRAVNEDRLLVRSCDSGLLLAVADGAGGSGLGAMAADTVVHSITNQNAEEAANREAPAWCAFLRGLDLEIESGCGGGETTAVVVSLQDRRIVGASVGDSKALLIEGDQMTELTLGQSRKPLLGSGAARPFGITAELLSQTLLVASDGLTNYIQPAELFRICRQREMHSLADNLINAVRLLSGKLQDDASVIAVRLDK